jgi:hypothetical protein
MAGISPGNSPGDRPARRRRRRELLAAAAVPAVGLAVVMAGCSRGSPNTQAPPASVSTSPAPSPTGSAATPHRLTDQELRAWAATLPKGPMPDVPTLSGRQGHFLLVDRGYRVPVPAGAVQLSYWSRTAHGLVVTLWTTEQADGYSDQYFPSYIELLRPDGRLVQIGHARMGGAATDPSGRYVAWLQAALKQSQPNTVHIVDLATLREVTRFHEPAWSSLAGWAPAGILLDKGGSKEGGFAVRTLDGREVQHPQQPAGGLEGVAGNRLLVREADCLRVIDLGSAFRTAAFGCATQWTYHPPSGGITTEIIRPVVALSSDGTWMMVDGVAVDVATLTRHATLMPAGIYPTDPTFLALDPAHVLGMVRDSQQHMIAAIMCDLPAGRCQKVPKPTFGLLW